MDLIEFRPGLTGRHPWEIARLRFFRRIIEGWQRPSADLSVLDVGAGDGWFSTQLGAALGVGSAIVCWDSGYSDAVLQRGELRDGETVRFVTRRPSERFDLLLLLDVLEHVEEDADFLADLVKNNLARGGHVLISVPAWPSLFGPHDRHLRHLRRYTPAACRDLLRGAGLDPICSGGLFHSLLIARYLQKALGPRFQAPADLGQWNAPAVITALILGVLGLDTALSRAASTLNVGIPGLSQWALCRAP
jgi:SAM-dependent methyltransferase